MENLQDLLKEITALSDAVSPATTVAQLQQINSQIEDSFRQMKKGYEDYQKTQTEPNQTAIETWVIARTVTSHALHQIKEKIRELQSKSGAIPKNSENDADESPAPESKPVEDTSKETQPRVETKPCVEAQIQMPTIIGDASTASVQEQINALASILGKITEQFNEIIVEKSENVSAPEPAQMLGGPSQMEQIHQLLIEREKNINELETQVGQEEKDTESKKKRKTESSAEKSSGQKPLIQLKLDKIEIPSFNGDLTQWIAFRDQYVDLIHNNEQLTPVVKFYQLKSHLTGLAADAISGFKVCAADYNAAWTVLSNRFDNKNRIIDEYISQFRRMSALHTATSTGLIQLVNTTNQLIRVLPTLGVNVDSWDPWIMLDLRSKLDTATAKKWTERVGARQDARLTELLEFLELQAQECYALPSTRPVHVKANNDKHKQKRQGARAFTVTTGQRKCEQCGKDHPIYKCPTFIAMSMADRFQRAKMAKLCFKCLGKHDINDKCRFGNCPTCKREHGVDKEHNQLLCYTRENLKKKQANQNAPNASGEQESE